MNKIIIIVGSLIMALTLGLLLVWPKYQELQVLRADVKEKELVLESQQKYFAQIKEITIKLQEYAEPLAKISSALPKEPNLASLINFLQINASQTGLILKKIVLGGTTEPKEEVLKETQVIIQVSGSYKSLKDMLAVIENSSRMIEVQNVSVEAPQKDQKGSPTFTLDIKTYSY